MNKCDFRLGEYVIAQGWCFGKIISLTNSTATLSFLTSNGTNSITFDINELKCVDNYKERNNEIQN